MGNFALLRRLFPEEEGSLPEDPSFGKLPEDPSSETYPTFFFRKKVLPEVILFAFLLNAIFF